MKFVKLCLCVLLMVSGASRAKQLTDDDGFFIINGGDWIKVYDDDDEYTMAAFHKKCKNDKEPYESDFIANGVHLDAVMICKNNVVAVKILTDDSDVKILNMLSHQRIVKFKIPAFNLTRSINVDK